MNTLNPVLNDNNWTVMNSAGAQVTWDMSFEAAESYLTPERFERGWQGVCVILVRSPEELEHVRAALKDQKQ